jgi:hypothetical protein
MNKEIKTRLAELTREKDALVRRGDLAFDRDDMLMFENVRQETNDAIVFLAGFKACLELLERCE